MAESSQSSTESSAALSADAWDRRYQAGSDLWDIGCPAPPFVNLLKSNNAPSPGRIVVLGSGSGHDAMLFAETGFEVVGVDFAPSAVARSRTMAAARGVKNIQFLQRNMFELEAALHHTFDYVLEHTCFCAIDPVLRPNYVKLVQQLLKPQGKLIALFYTHGRQGGPPFGVKPQAVSGYFTPEFEVLRFEPAPDSIARRQGDEHLGILQRR